MNIESKGRMIFKTVCLNIRSMNDRDKREDVRLIKKNICILNKTKLKGKKERWVWKLQRISFKGE